MSDQETAQSTLSAIQSAGFELAATRVISEEFHELQAENGQINLMRTNFEKDVGLTGIKSKKKASLSVNKTDPETLNATVENLVSMANAATADEAYGIAGEQPAEAFEAGPDSPDYDKMYDRIVELQAYAKDKYSELNLGSVAITFSNRRSCYLNSNGVQFLSRRGVYNVSTSFASKRAKQASSMMYTGYSCFDLKSAIHEATNVDRLLMQSVEQIETKHIPGKFTGDLLIAPNCLSSFLGFLTARIGDGPMVSGTSVYHGKLNEQVASEKLTLHCNPVSEQTVSGYWVTGDGYKAENSTILDAGVLNTYLLSLYGANKTGLARSVNAGGCYDIEPGEDSYEELVANVKEGILITRFSGGMPNDRGDFSGIAKNSYYIKDGEIQFPIKETTVSGNMADLLRSIKSVSKERLNFGGSVIPYVCATGISAS